MERRSLYVSGTEPADPAFFFFGLIHLYSGACNEEKNRWAMAIYGAKGRRGGANSSTTRGLLNIEARAWRLVGIS